MGFHNNAFATIWEVNLKDKYAELKLSTSIRNPDGTYETDFNRYVRFIGKAFEKIKDLELQPKDRIKLTEVDCKTRKEYTNFVCWDFEPIGKESTDEIKVVDSPYLTEAQDEDLPF